MSPLESIYRVVCSVLACPPAYQTHDPFPKFPQQKYLPRDLYSLPGDGECRFCCQLLLFQLMSFVLVQELFNRTDQFS